MVTKTINIKESAYLALKAMKREGESFSDVILRLSGGEGRRVTEYVRSLPPDIREEMVSSVVKGTHDLEKAHPRKVIW